MANTRDAVDTIKGYYYQFNYSILCILELNEDEEITVEGIEDVDITTAEGKTAIQCKYYSKTEYNHSVIAKAIRYMFSDYMTRASSGNYIYYKLFGTYESGTSKLKLPLSADFVKEKFFSYTEKKKKHLLHEELAASDPQINDFISKLTINVEAEDYESLEKKVVEKLANLFSCSLVEAEIYYYNNALRLIKELATSEDEGSRGISKRLFIDKINHKKMLFDNWYLQYCGIDQFCKKIKQEYFTVMNVSPLERYFLIECDRIISDTEIIKLLSKVSKQWSKLSKNTPKPFCPYVFLHGVDSSRLIRIKRMLVKQGLPLCDGYDFFGAEFRPESLNRTPDFRNGIKIKIINELSNIESILSIQNRTKEIYQFYLSSPFFESERGTMFNIQIPNTECISKMI